MTRMRFFHVGGPGDGQTAFAFRPYFRIKHPDHAIHQPEMVGDQPVMEWVDDDTRALTLHFPGCWPQASHP
jgi:hypothetical protein